MKQMVSEITIGDYVFAYCHSVEVESTWKELGEKAVVELPNVRGILDKEIHVGDAVRIRLGYDDLLVTEFEGYVCRISPSIPLRIECEDEAWQLKQDTVSASWRSIELKDLLAYLAPSALLDSVPAMTLAPFALDNVTRAQALQAIRDIYGLAVYFRGPQLFCGLPYTERDVPSNDYHFQRNIADFGSLAYRRREDVKVKVKGISIQPDNTRITVELGDPTGETHTLHYYNLNAAELKQQAEEQMKRLRFDGYAGTFTAFGQPNTTHSGIVMLADDTFPERAGGYYVDRVVTSYDSRGYRKRITIGPTSTLA